MKKKIPLKSSCISISNFGKKCGFVAFVKRAWIPQITILNTCSEKPKNSICNLVIVPEKTRKPNRLFQEFKVNLTASGTSTVQVVNTEQFEYLLIEDGENLTTEANEPLWV